MLQNFTDLLALRDYSEHDVLPFYAQDVTGVGGRFVVALTGNNAPEQSAGQYSSSSVGASYAGTVSLRYENGRKVTYATSGVSKYQVLGLTMYGTVEYDNNFQRIIYHPELASELGVVVSGMSTPIATDGYFRLKSTAYSGVPLPGKVGVISNITPGTIQFFDATGVTDKTLIVCKCLSSSGSAFGGYADIKLMLK